MSDPVSFYDMTNQTVQVTIANRIAASEARCPAQEVTQPMCFACIGDSLHQDPWHYVDRNKTA
eukprot:1444833-Prorocentrum_lima.AAC.1